MNHNKHDLANEKRWIETAMSDAGFSGHVVATRFDGEGKVVAQVTISGRTADGLPEHFFAAIEEAKRSEISLADAFAARNMYADLI